MSNAEFRQSLNALLFRVWAVSVLLSKQLMLDILRIISFIKLILALSTENPLDTACISYLARCISPITGCGCAVVSSKTGRRRPHPLDAGNLSSSCFKPELPVSDGSTSSWSLGSFHIAILEDCLTKAASDLIVVCFRFLGKKESAPCRPRTYPFR